MMDAAVEVRAPATTSRRRGWPVIDGGSRGAVELTTPITNCGANETVLRHAKFQSLHHHHHANTVI